MTVSLDSLYHSEFSFLSTRNEKDDLKFVDIITSFASAHGDVRISTELVPSRMSGDEQCRSFVERLELIETCQHFLIWREVPVWTNLTPAVAGTLLSGIKLVSQAERFSFLELTTNGSYPELNRSKDNPILTALAA